MKKMTRKNTNIHRKTSSRVNDVYQQSFKSGIRSVPSFESILSGKKIIFILGFVFLRYNLYSAYYEGALNRVWANDGLSVFININMDMQ